MTAIFKKEFKQYFLTPIGYIFISCFLFLLAGTFIGTAVINQSASVSEMFSNINLIFFFLVSLLTMRLLSEEKNKKTDQLLMSSPVSIAEIVFGKYLAAMAVFGISVVVSFVFPAIMLKYANPALSEIIGSYIGFILVWGVFIAIGLFMSSLTESQVIAAILTFVALTTMWFIESFTAAVTNPVAVKIISCINLTERYTSFQSGILSLSGIIYYLSLIFVFLFLTACVIDKRRYS